MHQRINIIVCLYYICSVILVYNFLIKIAGEPLSQQKACGFKYRENSLEDLLMGLRWFVGIKETTKF